MKDFAGLKDRITVAVAVTGRDDPYGVLNQELTALAAVMGELTTSRKARVKFDINGHASALSFEGKGSEARFMLQTAQVGDKPFALCDAAEFARLAAVPHIPALCEMLLQDDTRTFEEVTNAIRIVKSVRDSL